MLSGALFALVAGLTWGLVFVAPLLLPDYPALLLSASRYLAFGLIALPLAWWDRKALRELQADDWREALKLSLVGNLLYYGFLAAAVQRAGGPLPTVIVGTLPVVIAICSQWAARRRPDSPGVDAQVPWRQLAPALAMLAAGIALVNHAEIAHLRATSGLDAARYVWGALLAVGAVVCWTWYPMRNASWLRGHPQRSPRAWATAQGLATLPPAAMGFALFWLWSDAQPSTSFAMPLGPTPALFVGLMLVIGLLASWVGTLCWNEASRRLPTTLAGQLIVFETLAALAYAWMLRGQGPDALTAAGVALLVAGVVWGLRPPRQSRG